MNGWRTQWLPDTLEELPSRLLVRTVKYYLEKNLYEKKQVPPNRAGS